MAVSVIVFVEDVARSLDFYENVVGAELDHFDEDGSYGELKSGIGFAAHHHVEHHLDLSFHRNETGGLPGGFELDFAVDDVDAVFARAIEAGAEAVWEPRANPWGRSALLRDLDGVFFHVTEP
jgi:lactoylglutathione lyase